MKRKITDSISENLIDSDLESRDRKSLSFSIKNLYMFIFFSIEILIAGLKKLVTFEDFIYLQNFMSYFIASYFPRCSECFFQVPRLWIQPGGIVKYTIKKRVDGLLKSKNRVDVVEFYPVFTPLEFINSIHNND